MFSYTHSIYPCMYTQAHTLFYRGVHTQTCIHTLLYIHSYTHQYRFTLIYIELYSFSNSCMYIQNYFDAHMHSAIHRNTNTET